MTISISPLLNGNCNRTEQCKLHDENSYYSNLNSTCQCNFGYYQMKNQCFTRQKCTSSSDYDHLNWGDCRDPKMICQNRFCVCKPEFYQSKDGGKCYSNGKFIKI